MEKQKQFLSTIFPANGVRSFEHNESLYVPARDVTNALGQTNPTTMATKCCPNGEIFDKDFLKGKGFSRPSPNGTFCIPVSDVTYILLRSRSANSEVFRNRLAEYVASGLVVCK